MTIRWLGAGLILVGCTSLGCSFACEYKRKEIMLQALLRGLRWMTCELRYHVTPLPDLCRMTASQMAGPPRHIMQALAQTLEEQTAPDADSCMREVLKQTNGLPGTIRQLFCQLGSSLGCFDLAGQLEGLAGVEEACREALDTVRNGREQRLRSYQTLSFCAGAALVVLLI